SNTRDEWNSLLLQTHLPSRGFLLSKTIEEIENILPPYFVQVNQSCIINVKRITDTGKADYQFYIGEDSFIIAEPWRESAMKVIRLFLDDSRFWMIRR
ncbi:MAG: LytTR family transcriptional regulator DNA-binding domain-containing protein, partial [Chitinophagaceae bacterium]